MIRLEREIKIMGLILPQTVEMKVTSQNFKYYQDKGYEIPKRINKNNKEVIDMLNTISVNVLDLPPSCSSIVKITCDYCNEISYVEWSKVYNSLNNSNNHNVSCKNCKGMNHRLTNEDYLKQLNELNISITPLEKYIKSSVEIKHKCNICNHEWSASPNCIIRSAKHNINWCPCCSGRHLIVGYTDLWTTHPNISKMLANPSDGYKYSRNSEVKVDWICPECGTIVKNKSIHNTVNHKLSCQICNDNLSSGFKYVCSLLEYLNIDYNTEHGFDWLKDKRYDIYIPNSNIIIEVHGLQHYEDCGLSKMGRTFKEECDNDILKEETAKLNNINNYISIDCRKTEFQWQTEHIKNSKLSELLDLSNVNWKEVYENSLKSYVIKTCNLWNSNVSVLEIAKKLKISTGTVQRYLHLCTQAGLCVYKGLAEKDKPVVCLNTKEVFKNLIDAGEKYKIDSNGISYVCKKQRNRTYAGKLQDGTRLKWLFLDEYELKTKEEIDEILNVVKAKKSVSKREIICLNTLEIFTSIKEAKSKYNAPSVSDCCRNFCLYSGQLNGEKLKWQYYDEYLKTN